MNIAVAQYKKEVKSAEEKLEAQTEVGLARVCTQREWLLPHSEEGSQ